MPTPPSPAPNVYGSPDLLKRVHEAIKSAGLDLDRLDPQDLAPLDEFHIGDRQSTLDVAKLTRASSDDRVVDVGAGIGGTARTLASHAGCHVTAVDVTPEFCEVAQDLNQRTGLADRIDVKCCDAIALPLATDEFDIVLTQHTTMNIADKNRMLGEIARILRPGGRYGFWEIFAGTNPVEYYPLPWADDSDASFLARQQEFRTLLKSRGFRVDSWTDATPAAKRFVAQGVELAQSQKVPPLNKSVLRGAGWWTMLENLKRALDENCVTVARGVARIT